MNRDQAYALVRSTFTQAFDKDRFASFSRNLLNHLDERKASSWNAAQVKEAFGQHVHRYQRLGTYTSPEKERLDVLLVQLAKESTLERARAAIRDFVADYLKTQGGTEAALVAFVPPSDGTWRFSYVKMDYAAVERPGGKVGVETRLSPARRLSYIVGEGESCHTAQARFLGLLETTATDPTLADIEEAFSVEAVTKEFFSTYVDLFEEIQAALAYLVANVKSIRDDFKTNRVNTVDFAKKLMGQIVFLYFLQKKGWLGVAEGQNWGTGPRDFLRRLANGRYGAYDNFFNDILEPLFYDTLATDRGHAAWCNLFKCRIPFLNGGLFEPLGDYDWRKTDILLPNRLFTNTETFDGPITGTGVLDVFDRYNFTVNEAEPLEQEVAIDPEMLGKVFEALIEENRRKGLGAYYTPRAIVHYMCQESLINYLDSALNAHKEVVPRDEIETFVHLGEQISHYEAVDTHYPIKMPPSIETNARQLDERLAEITICDPAVGSGAFPVGMMSEIVRARRALTSYFNDTRERTPYHFKRHAIQNCLYGVDIDSGAIEIAKLRLWLSLVVDEDNPKQIKPLPNLLYKIVAGNSLLGVERNLFNAELFRRLEELKPAYFDETEQKKKYGLRAEIDDLIQKITNGLETFDFHVYFSEVFHRRGGFDVVIGNPPYVRIQELSDSAPKQAAYFKQHYEVATKGNYDLYVVFVERGLSLLQPLGHFAYILPHKFFNAQYGQPLRALIARGHHLGRVVHFGDQQVFPGATNYVCLLFLAKAGAAVCHFARVTDLNGWLNTTIAPEVVLPAARITDAEWNFPVGEGGALLARLQRMPVKLGEVAGGIFQGLATSADSVYVMSTISEGKGSDRVFSQSLQEEVSIESALLHPLLKGSDISRYAEPAAQYKVLFPYQIDNGKASAMPIATFRKRFPAGYKYLLRNKRALLDRSKTDESNWWLYPYPKNLSLYERPKLVIQVLSTRGKCFLDESGKFYFLGGGTAGGNAIRATNDDPDTLRLLLAILNSRLTTYYVSKVGSSFRGGFYAFGKSSLVSLPIVCDANRVEHAAVLALVERIRKAKQRDPMSDTEALEREIDRCVYKLYDLTPEEIALVENGITEKVI